MPDAWQDYLRRLSGPHAAFSSSDVAGWKPADFEDLCNLGLLQDAQPASHVLCPECFSHGADVDWTEDGKHAFIFCTSEGRPLDVELERLRQWEPHKERFVALLSAGLGIADRALNLEAGQLWRLGRCTVARRQRDVFFAAIAPDDFSSAVTEIRRGYGSVAGVLLLPSCAPDPGQNSKLRIVDLSNVTALCHDRIVVNLAFIEEQFTFDRRESREGSRLKGPARALKAHRIGILKAYAPNQNLKRLKALAPHLGVSPSALYGMVRDDRSRYSQDTLETVLSKICCPRAKWDRTPKPASRA